jgi:iron-sulfur cluster assembly accessory protein
MLPMTNAAADLVLRLADERGVAPRLRVRIVAGGCSGLTWDLELGGEPREGDHRRVTEGVTVVVDPVSASHLRGGRLELGAAVANGLRTALVDDRRQAAVVVTGVLAKHVCRCGESFAPA